MLGILLFYYTIVILCIYTYMMYRILRSESKDGSTVADFSGSGTKKYTHKNVLL